jgi:hypothetical protein
LDALLAVFLKSIDFIQTGQVLAHNLRNVAFQLTDQFDSLLIHFLFTNFPDMFLTSPHGLHILLLLSPDDPNSCVKLFDLIDDEVFIDELHILYNKTIMSSVASLLIDFGKHLLHGAQLGFQVHCLSGKCLCGLFELVAGLAGSLDFRVYHLALGLAVLLEFDHLLTD